MPQRLGGPSLEPSADDNLAYNEFYWDNYAKRWSDPQFGRDRGIGERETPGVVGEEWATPRAVQEVVDRFILPNVSSEAVVVEIGSGGGRIARRVAPAVGELWCLDVSSAMLDRLKSTLGGHNNVHYVHVKEPRLPVELRGSVDFVYTFDVFVHVDLHTQWRYVQSAAAALRPGGRLFLHNANLTTDLGWRKFESQPYYTVAGYYFMTPEATRMLIRRAGLRVVEEVAGEDSENAYLAQDLLVVAEKPAQP